MKSFSSDTMSGIVASMVKKYTPAIEINFFLLTDMHN